MNITVSIIVNPIINHSSLLGFFLFLKHPSNINPQIIINIIKDNILPIIFGNAKLIIIAIKANTMQTQSVSSFLCPPIMLI